MAERFLPAFLKFLSTPIVWLAKSAEAWDVCGICADIKKCIDVIDSQDVLLPNSFIVALIAAEDHRNDIHPGVDPISILRAIYVRLRFGKAQGASTIEQQFVRVVSGRYERTLARKAYEQALAICVSRRRTKVQIARAYLVVAYYGTGIVGIDGLRSRLGTDLWSSDADSIRAMIARLKYPEPSRPTEKWRTRVGARVAYIQRRAAQLERAVPQFKAPSGYWFRFR